MMKLIALAITAASITYVSVPAALWVYLTASGFQGAQRPYLFLLYIPLATVITAMWLLVIEKYKRFKKANKSKHAE